MRERQESSLDLSHVGRLPGLLVSVRDAAEATTALAAGADVIDVKEPANGPLGAADTPTIEAVVRAVDGLRPVTMALGELVELTAAGPSRLGEVAISGVSLFKIGLAGCGSNNDWQRCWRDVISGVVALHGVGRPPRPVAVVYADWEAAAAPELNEVLRAATEIGCPALLIDTWDKTGGTLFDHWSLDSLRAFVARVQHHSMRIVLAGSLRGDDIARAAALGPDLVAVRGAACRAGRNSVVCGDRVRELKRTVGNHAIAAIN